MTKRWIRVSVGLVAVLLTTLSFGCTKNSPTDINSLKVPAGFTYSTMQQVIVTATVRDVTGALHAGTEVMIGDAGTELVKGSLYGRGITDSEGKFERVISVPARLSAVRVQASLLGIANVSDQAITDNKVAVAFGPES
jgi:hypothetical protein